MPISLHDLSSAILQRPTVLFLGAGASVPSGAPTGLALAHHLQEKLADGQDISSDLIELATILERRVGRERMMRCISQRLESLSPKGGLMAVPEFPWDSLYTTNFDTLVERAYVRCSHPLVPIRSNYEYSRETELGTKLFKIHGCISQDRAFGNKSSMIITEDDYSSFADFRKCLFQRLSLDFMSKSVLFIGYSLRDPHVRNEIKEALKARSEGSPGQLYILSYERDEDRAAIWERQGVKVAFGGIDDFMSVLTSANAAAAPPIAPTPSSNWLLPYTLRPCTYSVADELGGDANPARMFNGSPALYADIKAGFTFARELEVRILTALVEQRLLVCTLVGVGGVGKTTLARRVLYACAEKGLLTWEHNANFPFRAAEWELISDSLRNQNKRGVLLIDNSPSFQGQVNSLINKIANGEPDSLPSLQILLVGERSAWLPRKKSPVIFSSKADVFTLSRLENADIERLTALARDKSEISRLVDPAFRSLSQQEQIARLKNRCSADMYVSLKHVFGAESLDVIILQEFAQLNEEHREIYRTVAALEASGTRVHRQLIIRLLGIESHILNSMLQLLEGVVNEYDISTKDGLYGWKTRHEVIARTIAKFKFADEEELLSLLRSVVEHLNPSLWIERQTIIDMCNTDFGIKRVSNPDHRLELYRTLVATAPGERVPRHRLISELMRKGLLDEADIELRRAQDSVGLDSPIHRYKTQILIRRAQKTPGLLLEDRRAFLLEAARSACVCIDRYPDDKYAYFLFAELADAFLEIDDDPSYLTEAIGVLRKGYERILDPDLSEKQRELIQRRVRLQRAGA